MRPSRAVYAAASLLGAALLFAVEPLFVKMALPAFGGAPAVWNVAFGFFTTMLLVGYLYAHALARLPLRAQVGIHAGVLLLAALLLPVRAAPAALPAGAPPSLAVLLLLLERIGLPFFALSATAPLVQSWFASVEPGRDPYRLFVASNLGSVAALLAYPFLIEPFMGLRLQSGVWAAFYALFALAMAACAAVTLREPRRAATPAQRGAVAPLDGAPRLRALWVVLSAIPTLLMLGLTSHLTAEVASLPFVWTAPLALYLVAFAVAFSPLRWERALAATPFVLAPVVVLLTVHEKLATAAYVALSLAAFFLLALGTIGRLAQARPPREHLTGFYLWVGLGGAIGAAAGSLVAPLVFSSIAEYPIAIVLSCIALPAAAGSGAASPWTWLRAVGLAIALAAATGLLSHFAAIDGETQQTLVLWVALAAGACVAVFPRRIAYGCCIAALFAYGTMLHDPGGPVIGRERNFFGTKEISSDPYGAFHFLVSGSTVHGIESMEPSKATVPRAYYYRSGPLGDVFAGGSQRFAGRNIAAVGLGIGAAGCYRTAGQAWTFYEIDPQVVSIANDPRYFTQLQACAPDARIALGDARLSLEREAPANDALIILDAYDSDQVPTHLLTREAFAVYLRQLTDDGVLAFHTSNRHFDLAPVLAALADDAGLLALERDDEGLTADDLQNAKMPSSWVVMTRRGRMLPNIANDSRWHELARNPAMPLWTDDYSSLARILRPEAL